MSDLRTQLKEQLIEQLNLDHLTPEDIGDNDPLFGEGLGLDSIDALEIIVLLDSQYGIKLANPEEGKEVFGSVESLATYIESVQK